MSAESVIIQTFFFIECQCQIVSLTATEIVLLGLHSIIPDMIIRWQIERYPPSTKSYWLSSIDLSCSKFQRKKYVKTMGVLGMRRKQKKIATVNQGDFTYWENRAVMRFLRNFCYGFYLQDAYLYGLIRRKIVHRKRPRSGERNGKLSTCLFVYLVSFSVCFS